MCLLNRCLDGFSLLQNEWRSLSWEWFLQYDWMKLFVEQSWWNGWHDGRQTLVWNTEKFLQYFRLSLQFIKLCLKKHVIGIEYLWFELHESKCQLFHFIVWGRQRFVFTCKQGWLQWRKLGYGKVFSSAYVAVIVLQFLQATFLQIILWEDVLEVLWFYKLWNDWDRVAHLWLLSSIICSRHCIFGIIERTTWLFESVLENVSYDPFSFNFICMWLQMPGHLIQTIEGFAAYLAFMLPIINESSTIGLCELYLFWKWKPFYYATYFNLLWCLFIWSL